ncbi:MAG TPA: ABC transporter ATP-binding protein [Burkholderiaceae bacterium]|nr:ABC transporter ATP-binding protein [Burkholderiaceae bacterium]
MNREGGSATALGADRVLALRADGVSVRFGSFLPVNGVTLHLDVGARQALVGPNGAGKTTLINLLTGVLRPTAGAIRIGDQDVTGWSSDRRARFGLARTFQVNTLFPSLTVLQSTILAIAERSGRGAVWWRSLDRCVDLRDEAIDLLTELHLERQADTCVRELPYGKQRLMEIALALAARPRVLLLDEPAAGVPEGEREELFDVINSLDSRISVLFIEHDMDLVFRFARRISVLVGGTLLTEGTPEEIARNQKVREVYLGDTDVHAA